MDGEVMDIKEERKAFEESEFVKTIIHKFEWSDEFNNYQIKDCVINGNVFEHIEASNDQPILNGAWYGWQAAKTQEEGRKFFSHDFNGDGFQYHDTLQEAKKAAEADLDIYRDRVADGNHIADIGEFNELAYGIVLGQAEWSVDCVVSADDHENGEYTQYSIGTEILSLSLSETQEQK